MNYGNEGQVLGDDEMTNTNCTNREEAPGDADVVMLDVIIPDIVTPGAVSRLRYHSRACQ
jgi:hypothetical protein